MSYERWDLLAVFIRLEIYTFANELKCGSVALCSCDEWACDLRPKLFYEVGTAFE